MQQANVSQAIATANQVLSDNFVTSPPTPILEIVKNYGFDAVETDLPPDVAALIDYDTRRIIINQDDTPQRKAFTIAHELGHILLHESALKEDPNRAIFYRKPLGQLNEDPLEKQANTFAAHLLVPDVTFERYKIVLDTKDLSKLFGVPLDVIGFRLADEQRHPALSRIH